MSLINDALKRASQSDRNRPRPDATHPPMKPVAGGRGWSMSLSLALGVGGVVALVLAGWCFWQWWNAGPSNAPVIVAAAAPKPAPAARQAVPPPQPVLTVAPAPVVPPPAPAPAPPEKPVEASWPAELKLMGILFTKTNPHALINGKTLAVGDSIDGIRVTAIENDRVTVEWNGRVKEMILKGK